MAWLVVMVFLQLCRRSSSSRWIASENFTALTEKKGQSCCFEFVYNHGKIEIFLIKFPNWFGG